MGAQYGQTRASGGSTTTNSPPLSAWAQVAMKGDDRAQPWKKHVIADNDPNFADGEELSIFNKAGMTLFAGEGSLAA